MCFNLLKNTTKACLLGLVLLSLSLSAYSQESPEDQIYQALDQIVKNHPDTKPQLKLIANGLQRIAEKQAANSKALQTTIDGQALKIKSLETTINDFPTLLQNSINSRLQVETDLKNYAANLKTEATVSEVLLIVSLVANGVQLFIKK